MTSNKTKLAVALVGGYVLGRTKKAKMALGLGMFLAGKKLSLDPRQLASALGDSRLLGGLDEQVRSELFDATRTAATTALTRRIGTFADTLHERAAQLEDDGEDEDRKPQGEHATPDTDTSAEAEHEPGEEPPTEAEAPAPRTSASSSRSRPSGTGKKQTARAARKTSSAARKTSSSASSTRRTASGTTRKTNAVGGGHG